MNKADIIQHVETKNWVVILIGIISSVTTWFIVYTFIIVPQNKLNEKLANDNEAYMLVMNENTDIALEARNITLANKKAISALTTKQERRKYGKIHINIP